MSHHIFNYFCDVFPLVGGTGNELQNTDLGSGTQQTGN